MIEIKFRAWVKRKNELIYLKGFRYSGNEKIKITFADKDGYDCTYTFLNKDVVLEQFIGLHDKNGVEIYENDVIELIDRSVVVKWNEYLCTFDIEFLKFKENKDNDFVFNGVKMYGLNQFEVIGNIHEVQEDEI